MTFCNKCGKQLNEGDLFCPACGTPKQSEAYQNQNQNYNYNSYKAPPQAIDSGHIGWGFLGFFFPVVGLILYLVWKDERPKTSLMAGKGALISVIVGAVFTVLALIAYAVFAVALFSSF